MAAGPKVSLDARRQPLNVEEIKKLDQSYRSVLHFCPLRPIVLATPVGTSLYLVVKAIAQHCLVSQLIYRLVDLIT